MLLRRSGDKKNETYNLNVLTEADEGKVGVTNEEFLLRVAEAVCAEDHEALAAIREEGRKLLGEQALVDAIAVASGFNGITKVANATGIPLDEATASNTVQLRKETKIDDYADYHKSVVYR